MSEKLQAGFLVEENRGEFLKRTSRFGVWAIWVLILICSVLGLLPRLNLERDNRKVAIIVDYRDIPPLAQGSGFSISETLALLAEKGVGGLMAGEFTGEDILSGLGPVEMRPAASHMFDVTEGALGTLFAIPGNFPHADRAAFLLGRRAGTQPFALPESEGIGVFYPAPMDALRKNGLIPDLEGLNAGTEAGLPLFYRVAPAQTWQMQQALEVTRDILDEFPGIALVAPSGEIALGYPDMKPLASLFKEHRLAVAQIEFSRQLGASQLNWLAFPDLLPLHSVTNEELLSRNISRQALQERLVRAVVERSVRLLVLRPAVSGNVGSASALENFGQEVEGLAEELRARGLQIDWPEPVFADRPDWGMSLFSASAAALALLFSVIRYLKRLSRNSIQSFSDESLNMTVGEIFLFVLLSGIVALSVWKTPAFARMVGALSAAFLVTEASLISMEDPRRLWRSLAEGIVFAFVGGLAVAALFSDPVYMLRLRAFSGVKLTLMLPPLLVLLYDMHHRIHPESLSEFLSRPPLWGELFLGLILLVLMALVLFRSDNVQFIPGIEAQIRNTLERVLVARPRNKEVFIGYPCLLLYAFAVKSGLWERYRELLRIGVALGFSSVINSFCHYHTPLLFILLREFHGLWVGVFLGIVAVAAVKYGLLPLWRKVRFVVE